MLKNELQVIEELLLHPAMSGSSIMAKTSFNFQFCRIRKAWENAAFSGMAEHSLVRYFNYHLEGISNLSDTLSNLKEINGFENMQGGLLSLIDCLKLYYSPYFNSEANAPVAYHRRVIDQLTGSIGLIRENLEMSSLKYTLKTCLLKWIYEMCETGVQYAFRSLTYFEYLVRQLSCVDLHADDAENKVITLLSRSNFNHLFFFVYRQNSVRDSLTSLHSTEEQLDYLQQQRAVVLSCPEVKNLVYDSNWPSLKTMMSEWLQEEIRLAELAVHKEREARSGCTVQKLPLDLSVSQLACLLRLFVEESIFATQNLKAIFNFFAVSYQTKRQATISPGSLSKEFYSIDQHTAARVRDILQRMVARINRNFFPVLAAVSITIHVYPCMH